MDKPRVQDKLIQDSSISQIPGWYIFLNRLVTYTRTGIILHVFCIPTLYLFLLFFFQVVHSPGRLPIREALLSMFFLSVMVTTQLDAFSRFQDYKMIKDLFYIYGFRGLLVKPYARSKCQRDAVMEAASQLGLRSAANKHFYNLGYRWYHIVPSVLIENPLLLLSTGYWRTTFFVPKYESKYFHW